MNKNVFGEWLRAELQRQRMTQNELALRMGVDGSYISRVVNGKYYPSWSTIQKFMEILHSRIMFVPDEAEELVPALHPLPAEMEGGGTTWWYVCGDCHGAIGLNDHYCKHCGRKVSWE